MHNELMSLQNINWVVVMHNQHVRHYMWEMSKIVVPALLTGAITFVAMRIIDNKNKKRWLSDGHIRRKTELEIEIRNFMLGIKSNTSEEYEELAKNNDYVAAQTICNFYKDFNKLSDFLKLKENPDNNIDQNYKFIFAIMDEYLCYVPKIEDLFIEFKAIYTRIFSLRNQDTLAENSSDNEILDEIDNDHEYFEEKVNAYLCFLLVNDRILRKLSVKTLR